METSEKSAGLKLYLGVVVMLFLIGLLVMVYLLIISGIKNSSKVDISGTIVNESLAFSTTCQNTSAAIYPEVVLSNVIVLNESGGLVPSDEYVVNGGCIAKDE